MDTLAASAYLDPEVHRADLERLWARSWVCVGRAADVPASGDQRAVAAGPETVLVVRDGEAVRAFFNVCRHRGHEILGAGEQTCQAFLRCPYHGWTYRLDGRRSGDDLAPVRIEEWHGWLFVNLSGDGPPFVEHAGDLASVVAAYRPSTLAERARQRYEVVADWKLLSENYHECLHCPQIHPELCEVSPPASGTSLRGTGAWVGGPMELADRAETMSFDGRSRGRFLEGVDRRQVFYLQLLPNLLLSLHPDYVMTHRLEPQGPGRTAVECSWLFPEGVADPAYAVEFWDRVNRQDWAACESVQRGVASRGYRPGRLTEGERDVARFLHWYLHS